MIICIRIIPAHCIRILFILDPSKILRILIHLRILPQSLCLNRRFHSLLFDHSILVYPHSILTVCQIHKIWHKCIGTPCIFIGDFIGCPPINIVISLRLFVDILAQQDRNMIRIIARFFCFPFIRIIQRFPSTIHISATAEILQIQIGIRLFFRADRKYFAVRIFRCIVVDLCLIGFNIRRSDIFQSIFQLCLKNIKLLSIFRNCFGRTNERCSSKQNNPHCNHCSTAQ